MAQLPLIVGILTLVVCAVGNLGPRYSRTTFYEDEILVRCTGLTRDETDSLLNSSDTDLWKIKPGGNVELRISMEGFKKIQQTFLNCSNIVNMEEIVQKAERTIEKQSANLTQEEWFEEYHTYDEIVEWWRKLEQDYPEDVNFYTIGKSYEGRDIPAVVITSTEEDVNIIYFQCLIHAREWISGTICMYIANYLMENKDTDERISDLLNQLKFVVVPIVNPDGYEYTWTTNRLWRKNRSPGAVCDGVDLNRNYNDHWEEGSTNPCSETYRGTSPASEPEVKDVTEFFQSLGNVIGAIDWHSYGQLLLRRYGWTMVDCPDEARLKSLADSMAEVIRDTSGRVYISQKSSQLYTSTGTASDWYYSSEANTNNEFRAAAYTIELRDTGQYGFILPPNEIIPTGEEVIPAFLHYVESVRDDPLKF